MTKTSRDPENTPLTYSVQGNKKWGYYVSLTDADCNLGTVQLFPFWDKPYDWATPQEARAKAAAVLRELADLIEAGE